MIIEIVILVIVLFLTFFAWLKYTYSYWDRKGVPSTPGTIPFGNLKEVLFCRQSTGQALWNIYKKYKGEKIVGFYAPLEPMLLVRDPELGKTLHIKEFNNFADNGFVVPVNVDPMLGINPFAIKGIPEWKDIRGIHTPVQTNSKIRVMVPEMARISQNLLKYIEIKRHKPIEVKDTLRFYTNDVVASCAYGIKSDSFFENSSFNQYTMKQMFGSDFGSSWATISGLFLPIAARLFYFRTISAIAQDFFESLAATCVKHREAEGLVRNDLIQHLMTLNEKNREENKSTFSSVEMAAHCVTFFIDGAETASIQLTFTLFELASNSEIQSKLRAEIKEAVNDITEFDFDKLMALPYLDMVFSESLRLHPPLPFVSRTCIQKSELGGVEVLPGTKLFSSILGMHRDEEYFPEPDRFIPERFSAENRANMNKDAFMPFGLGPRRCLGAKFAETEIKMALATIISNYKITLAEDTKEMIYDEKSTFFTYPKGKINLNFHPL